MSAAPRTPQARDSSLSPTPGTSRLTAAWGRLMDGVAPLILVAAALFLLPAAAPLTDGDTALYGSIALEMLRTGDWVTPSYPAAGPGYILDKPPLTLWLMAASFWVFGPTPFAARIWQIVLSLGVLLLTVGIGRLYLPRRAAMTAGWILLTALLFYYTGLVPQQDVGTVFFMLLAFYGFLRFLLRGGLAWYYLIWAALAGGVLTRGLSNLIMAGGTLLLFLVLERPSLTKRFGSTARLTAHLAGGLGLLLLIAVPWFWAETRLLGRPFLEVFFLSGNTRYYEADHNVLLLVFGYALLLPVAFLPWSGYLPHALLHGARQSRTGKESPDAVTTRFVLIWAAFTFGFIHLVAWRVIRYLLPVLPAAALLVAGLQSHLAGHAPLCAKVERTVRWIVAPVLLLLGIVAVAVWAFQVPPETAVYRPLVTALGLPLGLGGVWLLRPGEGTARSLPRASVPMVLRLMCTGLATYLVLGLFLLVAGTTIFPQRDIAQAVVAHAGPADRVIYSGVNPAVFYDFYLHGRRVERAKPNQEVVLQEGEVIWVITTPAEARRLQADEEFDAAEWYRAPGEVLLRVEKGD